MPNGRLDMAAILRRSASPAPPPSIWQWICDAVWNYFAWSFTEAPKQDCYVDLA